MTWRKQSSAIWAMRLLLAALFLFGSEIIFWTPPYYSSIEWVVRGVGYLLIATFTLDIAQRYLIRDGYDAMVVIAGTAILHGLLINPVISWAQVPQTLLTRIIGGDALVYIILWGIFLAWMQGKNRKYALYQLVGGAWLGMFWGFWMRWTPELRGTFDAVALMQMFLVAGSVFGVISLVYYAITAQTAKTANPSDVMLTPLEWLIWLAIAIVIFLYQVINGAISGAAFGVALAVISICWVIVWLRRDPEQDDYLIETHLPLQTHSPLWMGLLVASFATTTYIAYSLPLITDAAFVNQLWLMEIGSFAVGLLWLPVVAAVIATRAVDRMMREGWTI